MLTFSKTKTNPFVLTLPTAYFPEQNTFAVQQNCTRDTCSASRIQLLLCQGEQNKRIQKQLGYKTNAPIALLAAALGSDRFA